MNINIKTTGIEMSDAIRDYALEKVRDSLKFARGRQEGISGTIELAKISDHHNKGFVFRAEVNLIIEGKAYRADTTSEDLYASIDKAKDELSREISKGKGRREALIRRGARKLKQLLRIQSEKNYE